MIRNTKRTCFTLVVLAALGYSQVLLSAGRYAQMVFEFPEKRSIELHDETQRNSIVIFFNQTKPSELKGLEHYDERLIRRVFTKDEMPKGTEVRLVLRDKNIKASIVEYTEPYRVVIDLFDQDYRQEIDPITGLPLISTNGSDSHDVQHEGNGSITFVNPTSSPSKKSRRSSSSKDYFAKDKNFGKRKLFQPTPEEITTPTELSQKISETKGGRGHAWDEYPLYIFPIQTAAYVGRKTPSGWEKKSRIKALSGPQAMAEYALKLYIFGHENRAMVAYQQVLHSDPSIFDKDALHLWAFAEVNFGQGNLALADGYFSNLTRKFPESTLSKFAALRRLDIKAIRLLRAGELNKLPSLASYLNTINDNHNSELKAQKLIRSSYWSDKGAEVASDKNKLPVINESNRLGLSNVLSQVEGQRTGFVAASLILKKLIQPDISWLPSISQFAGQYFKKYKGSASAPYYDQLKSQFKERLISEILQSKKDKKYTHLIEVYESLPRALKSIRKTPSVAWALAESYRLQSQNDKALGFYNQVSKSEGATVRGFESNYWNAVLNARSIAGLSRTKSRKRRKIVVKSDRRMGQIWDLLNSQEKDQLYLVYKDSFKQQINDGVRLKTIAKIILGSWAQPLSTKLPESVEPGSDNKGTKSIYLLSNLAKTFKYFGMEAERVQAIKLMKEIPSESFAGDKKAEGIWKKELLTLADDYRKANQYLEAGRLYTYAAQRISSDEDRAETLYKGGLLLYRAGRRQEAVKAFTSASEDGNNLFYANLAKERLSQLKNKE